MMRLPRCAPLLLALSSSACIDFADPVIPIAVTPARVQAAMRVFDHGAFQVEGFLQPGIDSAGFVRTVESPFIGAGGFIVEPDSLGSSGMRLYSVLFPHVPDDIDGPFEFIAPTVRGVGELPTVRLWGLRRIGGDTIAVERGGDITLRIDTVAAASTPTPFRQWFLEIRGISGSFRISADGAPPATLRIPAEWVPPTSTGRVDIFLIYFQTVQLASASGRYFGSVVLDVRLDWIVELLGPS